MRENEIIEILEAMLAEGLSAREIYKELIELLIWEERDAWAAVYLMSTRKLVKIEHGE